MQRWILACSLLGLSMVSAVGCKSEPGWETPSLSMSSFEDDVYPVLIRDCAFQTCHGAQGRFFRVWGPGRVRLDPLSNAFDEATREEVSASFSRAISMVNPKDPGQSLLLRKPLAVEAGGAGHLGADKFGRNVYRTVDDEGYLTLSRWVYSVARQ